MAPAYLDLARGELRTRARRARSRLRRCTLCPRNCGVDRLAGELGECRSGELARVVSFGPHFGEEAPLVGRGGSGTIFFAGCNLTCVFCQNHDISSPAGDRGAWPAGTAVAAAPRPALDVLPGSLSWEQTPERIAHEAARYPQISRPPTVAECSEAVQETLAAGLWRLDR